MRWIVLGAVVAAMAVVSVSASSPIGSGKAYAGKMDGRPGGMNSANYGPSRSERAMKNSGNKKGMRKPKGF